MLERALGSTHPSCGERIFNAVLEGSVCTNNHALGYAKVGKKQGDAVLRKLEEIRLRGRKRNMIG